MSKHSIQITSIECGGASESDITNGDEVYLMCQADAGYPIRIPAGINAANNMKKGDTWTFDEEVLILNFEWEILVTIWDHDLDDDPNLATYLQSHDFEPRKSSEATTGSIQLTNHNGADYTIHYTYLD